MALEFDLESDADVSIDELREFLADAIDGEVGPGEAVFRSGMYVMSGRVASGDGELTARMFGFEPMINATYRFSNLSERSERDHNTAVMVGSVLKLIERYGGRGVLLFNGEQAVIQWGPVGVVFDSEWEDWTEVDEVSRLLTGHAVRRLPQPLLP